MSLLVLEVSSSLMEDSSIPSLGAETCEVSHRSQTMLVEDTDQWGVADTPSLDV